MKRTVEIEDTLQERVDSACEDVERILLEYLDENADPEDAPEDRDVPCLHNDLDYSGAVHEIVDGSVPVYTREIDDCFYLYGREIEQAFDDAGIGDKKEGDGATGWRGAAIYCYIQSAVSEWYDENAERIVRDWKPKGGDR